MVNDYIGVFLPLVDEFKDNGTEAFRSPWLDQRDPMVYNAMTLGTVRFVNQRKYQI